MAQSDSCPNLDLFNGAIVHSPQGACSDLGAQRGREDEEGEEEDEEVELAEEVGEDALMMGGGGEGHNDGESRERSGREEARIIQGALSPNGGTSEGEGGVEIGNKEHGMRDDEGEDEGEDESNDTIENPCQFSTPIEVEKGQERDLDSNKEEEEDRKDEENVQEVKLSSETELTEDESIISDDVYQAVASTGPQYVQVSVTVAEESPESSQSSTGDTDGTEVVTVPVMEVEDSTVDMTPATEGIDEQDNYQDDVCQTPTVSDGGVTFATIGTIERDQTSQLSTDENQNSQSSKREVEPVNDEKTWQQVDCIEGRAEDEGNGFVKDPMCGDDALDIVGEADQKAEEAELASEEQPQGDGGIEETGMKQKVLEEDIEEEGKTGVEEDIEHAGRDDSETHEEMNVPGEHRAPADPPEPVLQCVEEAPVDSRRDVALNQVEEVWEPEEGVEVEPDEPGAEATTEEGGDAPEHPPMPVKEAGTDVGGRPRGQAPVEDEKGGGAEEEGAAGEVETADEPVTVLDDGIEETGENPGKEVDEQRPDAVTAPPEGTTVGSKVEEHQVEGGIDEGERDGKGEVELDGEDTVKGPEQAMENGALSPEPQPLRAEERETARAQSPRKEDDDRVGSEPEEERAAEVQDWRRELRPVIKDGAAECERRRKEEKSMPRNEDWIKELKSVIKNESLPRRRDEPTKKKRVVLLEDGRSYFPRREAMDDGGEEVRLMSHRRAEGPSAPAPRDGGASQDQDYEVSLYVKVRSPLYRQMLVRPCVLCESERERNPPSRPAHLILLRVKSHSVRQGYTPSFPHAVSAGHSRLR